MSLEFAASIVAVIVVDSDSISSNSFFSKLIDVNEGSSSLIK